MRKESLGRSEFRFYFPFFLLFSCGMERRDLSGAALLSKRAWTSFVEDGMWCAERVIR